VEEGERLGDTKDDPSALLTSDGKVEGEPTSTIGRLPCHRAPMARSSSAPASNTIDKRCIKRDVTFFFSVD
jgi:hypothetical protein